MQYVLGNMLNGGGGLNPDGLALDLQFAADKTLTARKGPTPVFTRASSATFVGSNGLIQSAATNIPRFDHTSAGVCRGLLIEESRTNLYSRSEEFDTVFWTKTRSSITADATTAPDGTLTADKFVEDTTASNTHTLSSSVTPSATAHTLSVFAKKGERTWIVLRLGAVNTFFDLDGGTIAAGSINSPTITNFGNGWYRCTVTSSAGTQGQFWLATNSTTTSYTGDGTSGLFLWGAQLEAGSFATSYIPTTTGTVVRSADVCSISGSDFNTVYNESEHTLFVQASAMNANFGAYLSFDNSTINEQSSIGGFPSPIRAVCYVVDGGTTQANPELSITLNQSNKIAAGMKLNSFQVAVNNATGTQDASGTMPTANTLKIGRAWNSATISGTYAQVKVFKKRLLNAKLQALTA